MITRAKWWVTAFAGLFELLSACSAVSHPPVVQAKTVGQADYTVVDVMPRFWRFVDQSAGKDSAESRRLFHEIVVAEDSAVFSGFSGGPSDATLGRWLRDVQPYLAATRRLDARLATELPLYRASFMRVFPDARWDNTSVYFMPWFFISDAGVGQLPDGRQILVFGVDDIARYRGPESNLATVFHHELFHLYHARAHPEWAGAGRGPLYRAVWGEGLAEYVGEVLNPAASLEDVVGAETVRGTQPRVASLAKEIREQLDSTSSRINRDYMSASPIRKDLPPRSGYYVGLLVARRLSKQHSLAELVRLRDPELRVDIERALRDIEADKKP